MKKKSPFLKKKPKMETNKILSYLGLAAASRTAVTGTELVLSEVRRGKKGVCVLMSSDVSERTAKQITDKCTFYKVPLIKLACDMYEVGKRTGKKHPVAAAAVTNPSLTRQILKCTEDNEV